VAELQAVRLRIFRAGAPDPADTRLLLAQFSPGVQRAAWVANRYLDVRLVVPPMRSEPVVLLIAGKVVASVDA
jgi:hypothetical protein